MHVHTLNVYFWIFLALYILENLSFNMWLCSLTRTRPCPFRHAQTQTHTHAYQHTQSQLMQNTLTVYWRPCKLDNRCQMQTWCACWFDCSVQTADELWTGEETLIWMETSCHCLLVQLLAPLAQKTGSCVQIVLIDKLGECEAQTYGRSVLLVTRHNKAFLFNTSVYLEEVD